MTTRNSTVMSTVGAMSELEMKQLVFNRKTLDTRMFKKIVESLPEKKRAMLLAYILATNDFTEMRWGERSPNGRHTIPKSNMYGTEPPVELDLAFAKTILDSGVSLSLVNSSCKKKFGHTILTAVLRSFDSRIAIPMTTLLLKYGAGKYLNDKEPNDNPEFEEDHYPLQYVVKFHRSKRFLKMLVDHGMKIKPSRTVYIPVAYEAHKALGLDTSKLEKHEDWFIVGLVERRGDMAKPWSD